MTLLKLAYFYPNHKDILGDDDIKGYAVYSETDEKIGDVDDVLVDESGRFRYFVIDTGLWVFGKKVLLPVGRARTDYDRHRVYATGMTKEQAENLPEYNENTTVDYDYEERVRNVYRAKPTAAATPTYDHKTSYRCVRRVWKNPGSWVAWSFAPQSLPTVLTAVPLAKLHAKQQRRSQTIS